MSRIVLANMVTLDGYFEGPKSWEIDWHEYFWGEEMEQLSLDQLSEADGLLFGRITYEGMAAYWPSATGAVADVMNSIPKVVFSRTLQRADWNNTRLVNSDATEEVAELRQKVGGSFFIFGSGALASGLSRQGLIDEYRLWLSPLVLGGGNPLFKPSLERLRLRLLEARPMANSGLVVLRYEPAEAA